MTKPLIPANYLSAPTHAEQLKIALSGGGHTDRQGNQVNTGTLNNP